MGYASRVEQQAHDRSCRGGSTFRDEGEQIGQLGRAPGRAAAQVGKAGPQVETDPALSHAEKPQASVRK